MADPHNHPVLQLEREQKFDLEPDAPLPDLDGLLRSGASRVRRLRAVYLDTPDLLLIRQRITLRRREGGGDEGWHLKLPAQEGSSQEGSGEEGSVRWELHAPLTDGPGRWRVPPGHVEAVAERLGEVWTDRPDAERGLVPVAILRTHRTEVDLLDDEGRVAAVLCDDVVQAEPAGHRWRELEVELVGDHGSQDDLLGRIAEHLAVQGVRPANFPSKLSRALGDRPQRAQQGLPPDAEGPAADVVLAHLAEQVAVILGREATLREDGPASVHKTRVATRRLRSALRTFRRLLDREVTDPLRQEVKWYAEVLGAPRDAEVMRAAVLADLAELPSGLVLGPVADRVREELDGEHARAHAALVEVLDGPRYAALVDQLVDLLADPPWRGRAERPAAKILLPLVAQAVGRVEAEWQDLREAEEAAASGDTAGLDLDDRMHRLHEIRKRAKAARYAHEAVAPSFGQDAAALAAAWEKATEALGVVQDSVVGEERLRRLTLAAREAGDPDFTYGVLVGRQLGVRGPMLKAGEGAVKAALQREQDLAGE
ncbi:CYTH and CHAD domain-containing protein [Ornithinimicrobium pratense]|uniref:CYTH and CHAD domain-containing protein n=1 Tax=Ornithinimicrobium pratense TaxID=2593973 RepID=A0A5J6V2I6_9MICO|nr:CYTH and CHAD domain-containing protein [Ornithinimicrobium pratense]QFG67534.1 CYTH and CHAD domain-containing protein [Ornithinimicrobium pratense]